MKMKSKASSLYIHIPFCKNICTYCDFIKFIYNQKRIDEYFKSLFFEFERIRDNNYKTIYIGGGTPSCIDKTNLEALLSKCALLIKNKNYEFTIECNVEDINEEFLKLIKKYKVNRLSIGVQSFNEKIITYCNRHHDKNMAIDKINLAAKYIKNISIDLIYAFQNQSLKALKDDLKIAFSLPIKHLSYYSLLIEENTILYAKKVENVNDEMQAKMYRLINLMCKKNHFHRYEISNFAKNKKYESKHNKVYWHNEHYDALGLAASSYIGNERIKNISNIIRYNQLDYTYDEVIKLDKKDIEFEEIMLRLRLDEGLDLLKFNKKFNCDFITKYQEAINKAKTYKLIKLTKGKIKTTFKGSLLLNDLLELFLN